MNVSKFSLNTIRRRVLFIVGLATGPVAIGMPDSAMATSQTGQITQIMQTGSRYFIYLTGDRDHLSCDCCNRWEITIGSRESDAMIAAMLTAFTTGKTVMIQGTGTCVAGSADTEGVALYTVLQ